MQTFEGLSTHLNPQDFLIYKGYLISSSQKQKTQTLEVTEYFKRRVTPFPSKIGIKDD